MQTARDFAVILVVLLIVMAAGIRIRARLARLAAQPKQQTASELRSSDLPKGDWTCVGDSGSTERIGTVELLAPDVSPRTFVRVMFDNQPIKGHAVVSSEKIPGDAHDTGLTMEQIRQLELKGIGLRSAILGVTR